MGVTTAAVSMLSINVVISLVSDRPLFDRQFLRICLEVVLLVASLKIQLVDLDSMNKSMYLVLTALQFTVFEDCLEGSQFTRLLGFGFCA